MAIKLLRIFFGGYEPDYAELINRKFVIIPRAHKRLITVLNSNQGFGQINGVTTEDNASGTKLFPNAQICVFKKSTKELLWETRSKTNGDYHVRNIAVGLECFVVAFDPNHEYNAVIEDAVVAK